MTLPLEADRVDFSVMAKPDEKMAVLEERTNWHRNIGWGAITVFVALFGALMTWYIPKEMASLRESMKADNAAQIAPINEKLARLTVLVELKQSKDVAQVLKNNADFTNNPKLAIQAVSAVSIEARSEGIRTDPEVLKRANGEIKQVVERNPDLLKIAWEARLELVGYRTFLNSGTQRRPAAAQPVFKFLGAIMSDGSIDGGGARQKLDGAYWRNYTFKNVTIEYDGGPMALENVVFIDCTFQMNFTPGTDKFANTLLADNRLTELFR
jgi:hypothetical protein